MLHVKSIQLDNFMRLKNVELNFPEDGIFGILAQGATNKRRSNFLGKSTITKAIRYGLTGMYDGEKETDLIHNNEQKMSVVVTLSDGERDYTIKRARDHKNNGLVELDWIDKTTEAKKAISDLIGLDKDDFDLTSFFKQEEINSFMLLSNTEKKKRVMRWQKNDHWSDKERKVLDDIKTQNEEISNLKFKISNNKLGFSGASSIDSMQVELSESKEKLQKLQVLYKKTKEEFDKLSIEKSNSKDKILDLELDLNDNTAKLSQLYKNIKAVKFDIERYKSKDELEKIVEENTINLKDVDLDNLKDERITTKNKINELTNKFSTFKKYNTGICPIINESCDRLSFTPKQEKKMLDEIDVLKEKSKTLHESILKYDNLIMQLNQSKSDLNKIELLNSKLSPLLEQYKATKKLVEDLEKKVREAVDFDDDNFKEVEQKCEKILKLKSEESAKIKVIEYKIEEAEKKLNENVELEERLLTELQILDNRKYLAYMFGKNGIPSLEIENSFQIVEDEINSILKELDSTLGVIFKPFRELSSYESHCVSCNWAFPKGYRKKECEQCNEERRKKRSDEIILNVIENGTERPFSVCSGGLKTLVSIAVRTALAMLLKRSGSCRLNILFLDEIDSALDQEFKEKVKDLVVKVLHKKLGFNQIFWISHDKGIINQIPKILMVKGYQDYSNVEWL